MGASNSKSKPLRALTEEEDKRRRHIVGELIATEETYSENLAFMHEVLSAQMISGGVAPVATVRSLFGQTETLCGLHRELLRQLKERTEGEWKSDGVIGDIFISMSDMLRCYSQYANQYPTAFETLQGLRKTSRFVSFQEEVLRNPRCKGLDVASFLILPIQRIPRYLLLLQDLLKHTPSSHPDARNLAVAVAKISEIAASINEKKRESEAQAMLVQVDGDISGQPESLVQPHRSFVLANDVTWLRPLGKSPLAVRLLLFNDMVVVARYAKSVIWGPKLSFELSVHLEDFIAALCIDPSCFEIVATADTVATKKKGDTKRKNAASESPASGGEGANGSKLDHGRRQSVAALKKSSVKKEEERLAKVRSTSSSLTAESPKIKEEDAAKARAAEKDRIDKDAAEGKVRFTFRVSNVPHQSPDGAGASIEQASQTATKALSPEEWVSRIQQVQIERCSKLEAWDHAKETKGGAAARKCCCAVM